MSSNSSLNIAVADFDELAASFKQFLKGQDLFRDYVWEGSNLGVLIDLMAYNASQLAFYANFIGSEMFLDSSSLKDSIISHCKELNYLPRSFRSAKAVINIRIAPLDIEENILIPKGTSFSTRVGSNSFSFTVPEHTVISNSERAEVVFANNVSIYEGSYLADQYVVDHSVPNQRFILSNPNIDTSSLNIIVKEDSGSVTLNYSRADSTYDLNGLSEIYFIQAAEGERYEILFGDGVIGRKPKNGATVIADYRASSGELPNGALVFTNDGPIDGHTNVAVITVNGANGGAVSEPLESIRLFAPRSFKTQERAITTSDYETLLLQQFSDLRAVSIYGGEEIAPPQYGKVFISGAVKTGDVLTNAEKENILVFLKSRAPISIIPEFVDPEQLFVDLRTAVNYSFTKTALTPNDIRTLVFSEIQRYSMDNLGIFKAKIRYSKLLQAIDDSHPSIISSTLDLRLSKRIDIPGNSRQNIIIKFNRPFPSVGPQLDPIHPVDFKKVISSSSFIFNGFSCELEDNGAGIIRIVSQDGSNFKTLSNIGTINYNTGEIQIPDFTVTFIEDFLLKIFADVPEGDIETTQNTILDIAEDDIEITVTPIRDSR